MTSAKLVNEELYLKKFVVEIDFSELHDEEITKLLQDLSKVVSEIDNSRWIVDIIKIIKRNE
jgi:hypothetical protein